MGAWIGIFAMCLFQINRKNNNECLHCGKGHADYCEKCYQELIGKNSVLQLEKDMINKRVKALKGALDLRNKYIIDLEYIRDCYYKEIEYRKIFKTDTEKKPSNNVKTWVVNNEIIKHASEVNLYKKEEYSLKENRIPIIVYVNEKEYKALKTLSETYENITYNTEDGIYIE